MFVAVVVAVVELNFQAYVETLQTIQHDCKTARQKTFGLTSSVFVVTVLSHSFFGDPNGGLVTALNGKEVKIIVQYC